MEPKGERPQSTTDQTSELYGSGIKEAREKGRERLDKFLDRVAPLFAPEVLFETGTEIAKEKAEEMGGKIKSRANEIVDSFAIRAYDAAEKLDLFYEEKIGPKVEKATEMGKRAAELGLKPVVKAEDIIRDIYTVPAKIREATAKLQESKAGRRGERAQRARDRLSELMQKETASVQERHKEEKELIVSELEDLYSTAESLEGRLSSIESGEAEETELEGLEEKAEKKIAPIEEAREAAVQAAEGHRAKAEETRTNAKRITAVRSFVESLRT